MVLKAIGKLLTQKVSVTVYSGFNISQSKTKETGNVMHPLNR